MPIKYGLTTWNVALWRIGLCWRWNMRLAEALHTCRLRRCGRRSYATLGPLIVEW
jgi:hypothetical protein